MKLKKIVSLLSVLGTALVCTSPAAVVSGEASVDTRYHHAFAEPFLAEYAPAAHGGLYFDENGTLVVNVLPDAACNNKIVETVTKQMPIKAGTHVYRSTDSRKRVEIKTVTHSYQELLDAFHILSDNMIRLGIQSVAIREAENVVLVIPEPGGHATLQKEIDTLVDSNVVKIDYSIENSPSEQRMKHVFT